MAQYLIGIDLGTTNSTVAYHQLDSQTPAAERPRIESFAIKQRVAADLEGSPDGLPSFLYFPLENEAQERFVVGGFARDRGGELPGRLISSAKSWLCHDGIDRRAAILPLNSEDCEERMSPVAACAAILEHIRKAWDAEHPDAPLAKQRVLITVPASFDPSARQLVQEAAQSAAYPEVVLLEEPQAAFYAWLHQQHDGWRKELSIGDKVLVVDIGGGTTDFTLISVSEEEGELGLERIAVGNHLLLGGDNMDLALAYKAKQQLEDDGHSIDDWQLKALVHACRKAKEVLLSDAAADGHEVTIQGRGRKLIGNSLTTTLTRESVKSLLLDGFMPLVPSTERSQKQTRSGLADVGLPFAQDPRVSSQLAAFLAVDGSFQMPTHVLFNGGSTKAQAVRQRLLNVLNQWAQEHGLPEVKELPEPDFDRAVSRGATYYGLAREGQGIRIKGGSSRSYYIGVEEAIPAVPGLEAPLRAICIVPFGMEEGSSATLEGQLFSLVLGDNARFRFFSRSAPTLSNGVEANIGMVVRNWKDELEELHPIETALERQADEPPTVNVHLESSVTELGVLELWCVAADGRRWKLEFDIRETEALTTH